MRTHGVEIDVEAGTTDQARVSILNFPFAVAPVTGDRVAVVDAVPTRVETDLRLAWDSSICRWQ